MKFTEIWSRVDKKRLLKAYAHLLGAAASAVVFWEYRFQGGNRSSANSWKTVVGFVAFFVMAAFLVGFVRIHKSAVPKVFFEWLGESFMHGLGKGISFIFKPISLLLRKLGLTGRAGFLRGRDERSFFFMRPGSKKRRKTERMPKWKNLTNNSQRVRFLFMKYMNYRIKKGYLFNKFLSPAEIRAELEPTIDPEDEDAMKGFALLFDHYPLARYDAEEKNHEILSDELITDLRDLL